MFSYPKIEEVKCTLSECEREIIQDHVDDQINFFREEEIYTETQPPVESNVQENKEEFNIFTEPELTEPDQIERQFEQVDSIQLEKEWIELIQLEEELRSDALRIAQRIAETAVLREAKENQIRKHASAGFSQEHQTSDPSIFASASDHQRENQLHENTGVVSNQECRTNSLSDPSNTSKTAQQREIEDRSRRIFDANFNRELDDYSPPTASSSRFYQQNAPASDTFKIGRTSATTLADTTRKTMNSDLWNSLSIREQYDKAVELRELRKVHSPPTTLSPNLAQQVALASEIRENQMRKNPDAAIAQDALSQDSYTENVLSQGSFAGAGSAQTYQEYKLLTRRKYAGIIPEENEVDSALKKLRLNPSATFGQDVSAQEHRHSSITSSVTQQNPTAKLEENQISENAGAGSAQASKQNESTSAFTKLRENQMCKNADVISAHEHEKSSNPKKAKRRFEEIDNGNCDIM